MSELMDMLFYSFGEVLRFIYDNFTPQYYKYGISIIIFTILIKLILLPIAIKQQKQMVGMKKIQPLMDDIKSKYKNDANKMSQEMMKLYAEHKVNPLGGCLPALVQLPIFIALYGVIMQPLKYINKISDNELGGIQYTLSSLFSTDMKSQAQMVEKAKEVVVGINPENIVQYLTEKINALPNLDLLMGSLRDFKIESTQEAAVLISRASNLSMDFLGLNLAQSPSEHFLSPVILIPIIAALTTYISSQMMKLVTPSTGDNTTQNTMMAMMPVMTLFITYTLPAGLGLYWIVSNIIQTVQQYVLNKSIPREVNTNK